MSPEDFSLLPDDEKEKVTNSENVYKDGLKAEIQETKDLGEKKLAAIGEMSSELKSQQGQVNFINRMQLKRVVAEARSSIKKKNPSPMQSSPNTNPAASGKFQLQTTQLLLVAFC